MQEMRTDGVMLASRLEHAGVPGRDDGSLKRVEDGLVAERLEAALRAEAAAVAEVDFLRVEREALEAEFERVGQTTRAETQWRTGFGLGRLARVGAGIEPYEWKDEPQMDESPIVSGVASAPVPRVPARSRNGHGVRYGATAEEQDAPAWIAQNQRVERRVENRRVEDRRVEDRRVADDRASEGRVPDGGDLDLRVSDSRVSDSRVLDSASRHDRVVGSRVARASATAASHSGDSLIRSRERVASRWFALSGVFENGNEEYAERAADPGRETKTPVLAVFSLTGGVGKTSLVAAVGRALSGAGEKVLLADTTVPGLLPYYFGSREVRPGVVRTFSPPNGSGDAAIQMVSLHGSSGPCASGGESALACEIRKSGTGANRVLVDMDHSAGPVIRGLTDSNLTVLVPLVADMNSVISLQAMENNFEGAQDADGHAILPYYVLNQFDASSPLQLDVREVLREKLGERLLPFAIRRAAVVGEALAEGMTVMDYASGSGAAEDYGRLAEWVRSLSAAAMPTLRDLRWSER